MRFGWTITGRRILAFRGKRRMSEAEKLESELRKRIKELQDDCPHEQVTDWKNGYRRCLRCGKNVEIVKEILKREYTFNGVIGARILSDGTILMDNGGWEDYSSLLVTRKLLECIIEFDKYARGEPHGEISAKDYRLSGETAK